MDDPTPSVPIAQGGGPPRDASRLLRRPDPGSRRAATVTLLLLIPVLLVVVLLQQFSVVTGGSRMEEVARAEVLPPSAGDGFTMMSKMMVKFDALLGELAQQSGQPRSVRGADLLANIDTTAQSPSEKVRAAVVAAELVGTEGLGERLNNAADAVYQATLGERGLSVEASTMLLDDLETIEAIYDDRAIEDDARDGLVARHGWFGELALARGDADARAALTGGGGLLLALLATVGGVLVLAFTGGIVMLVLAVVFGATGKLRASFVPPLPGGSVYLETFGVFVGGFLLIQVVGAMLSLALPEDTAVLVSMGLQWTLVLTVAWPLLRGVPKETWREQIGLTAPRGVWREIGAGVMGYLAGIPMYIGAAAASMLLLILREFVLAVFQRGEPAPIIGPSGPVNPVFELVASQGLAGVIVLGSLVVLWAPLVEELIMRGALYRHLRSRLHWVVSAIVSAMLFGMLHQYDVLMLLPVISLGLVFAAVREWRGSVIGCITGHMLHNATVFALVLAMLVGLG